MIHLLALALSVTTRILYCWNLLEHDALFMEVHLYHSSMRKLHQVLFLYGMAIGSSSELLRVCSLWCNYIFFLSSLAFTCFGILFLLSLHLLALLSSLLCVPFSSPHPSPYFRHSLFYAPPSHSCLNRSWHYWWCVFSKAHENQVTVVSTVWELSMTGLWVLSEGLCLQFQIPPSILYPNFVSSFSKLCLNLQWSRRVSSWLFTKELSQAFITKKLGYWRSIINLSWLNTFLKTPQFSMESQLCLWWGFPQVYGDGQIWWNRW